MTDRVGELLRRAGDGDNAAVGRLITLIERGRFDLAAIARQPNGGTQSAHLVGLTGAPGVGKSTALAELTKQWRTRGQRVAILAVDPSSHVTGGAVLGDRARMATHILDAGVFIRSLATRGRLGGLAEAVPPAAQVLKLAGFDVIAVETVGVGQSETEVAGFVDTNCVLLPPGMGDGLQALKAGIMETGDVFVVTKSDLPGAADVSRVIRSTATVRADGWRPPVVLTSAVDGEGFEQTVDALDRHRAFASAHGVRAAKLAARTRQSLLQTALDAMRQDLETAHAEAVDELVDAVAAGTLPVAAAAEQLLIRWRDR